MEVGLGAAGSSRPGAGRGGREGAPERQLPAPAVRAPRGRALAKGVCWQRCQQRAQGWRGAREAGLEVALGFSFSLSLLLGVRPAGLAVPEHLPRSSRGRGRGGGGPAGPGDPLRGAQSLGRPGKAPRRRGARAVRPAAGAHTLGRVPSVGKFVV